MASGFVDQIGKPAMPDEADLLSTPDGRYFVIRGRLWRMSNPDLQAAVRRRLVDRLMDGRRQVKSALRSKDAEAERAARALVDEAKRGLGERGPVWWTDGEPDLNRRLVANTPYADWYAEITNSN